jgi:hypothetical protein
MPLEERPGVRARDFDKLLRGALGDEFTAPVAALGTQVNNPIRHFDDL